MAAAPSWNDGRCGLLACTAPPSAPCDASARQTLSQGDRVVFEVPEGWVLAPLGTTPSTAARQQPQWPQLQLQRPQAQQPQWQQPLRQPQQLQQPQWQQPQWQQPQWQQQQQRAQQQPMQQQPPLQPFMQQPARQQQQQQQAFLQASSLLPAQHQPQQSLLQHPLQQPVAQKQVQQVQPALPLVESSSQASQRLTRGARRHLKQRLRKKLGKLERARAAAEMAAQDELADEADFAAECGSQCCHDHCEEHWSDSDSTEAPHSQHSPISSLWTSEEDESRSENQDIPSYAIEDLMHIPADAFSGLPQEWEASADEEHCIVSRGRSPRRMECLPHAVPLSAIPSKNTFVHFPMERVQPPRRSRSV